MAEAAPQPQVLSGTTVLDLSEGVAGAYASKLLADLGADVIKVERPDGDPLRRYGPFPAGRSDPEAAGLFLHLNANKRGIVLDLDDPAERAQFETLAARADLVLHSRPAEEAARLGLTYDALSHLKPRLVVTSVTPFGTYGPYAGWKSDELVEWAMGGYMHFAGLPEGEPLFVPGHQAALHAGQHAAIGSLAALHEARRSGLGQDVEVSHLESMLLAHAWLTVAWTHEGQVMKRAPSTLMPCGDGGLVAFFAPLRSEDFFVLIERFDLIGNPEYSTPLDRMRKAAELQPLLREWCLTQKAADVQAKAQELRIACTYVANVEEISREPQMLARNWFETVEHPVAGTLRHPGMPYKLSEAPARISRPAPRLGEHTREVLAEASSAEPESAPASGDANPTRLPLEGVKVVEVTANWAGPLAGRHLGDLGAEVVKVEYATRPATRAGRFPGSWRAPKFYNRSGYFNKLNRNKMDACIDLGTPDGKEAFLKLVDWADVVIENNSARVMPNLGLGYEALSARNPAVIMVSMSGFGATGPYRDFVAYGANIELSCGLVSLSGYRDGTRCNTSSFYADPVAGNHGAVAVLAALEYRRRTGKGQYIDISLNESAAGFFCEAFMDFAMNGAVRGPIGSRSLEFAPQGVYPCAGEDSWLALSVHDEAEWRALCAAMGREDLAARSDLTTAKDRQAAHDEIDDAIREWAGVLEHRDAAARLQAAGVRAGPVLANWEIVGDPHLHERGYLVYVNHPEAGVLPYPGFGWKLSRTPAQVRRHSPCFAEHNREVFAGILGISDEDIARLYENGTTSDDPRYPEGSIAGGLV
jgi:crotonobetainyl-CoA:carnitine CoA-transferase CaiB-like acyl-CoA transferase